MHTVHNARVQLLATTLNNVALAFIVAGLVAPLDEPNAAANSRQATRLT